MKVLYSLKTIFCQAKVFESAQKFPYMFERIDFAFLKFNFCLFISDKRGVSQKSSTVDALQSIKYPYGEWCEIPTPASGYCPDKSEVLKTAVCFRRGMIIMLLMI